MSRSEALCNSAENRDPTLSTPGLGPHCRNACERQKTHTAPADQTTAICTWRYTPALAVLTIHPGAYFWRLTNGGVGAAEKDPIMRRFPRGEQPGPPSPRRVAAAGRAVQAEKTLPAFFPELVTHHTRQKLD